MADYQGKYTGAQVDALLDKAGTAVQQVAGKGLSTNDYTNADKEEVAKVAQLAQEVSSLQANSGGIVDSGSDKALATLCGQPPILFGAGTPQEAVVPMNWKQFDAETGEGYNWNGEPSAIGQQYINTSVSTGGRYVAVPDDNGGLTWKNF